MASSAVLSPRSQASYRQRIKAIVDRPPQLQRVGDPLIDNFREAVLKHAGRSGFRGISIALSQRGKTLTAEEFEATIKEYGLTIRREDIDHLLRYYDVERRGTVAVASFLKGVRPTLPISRMDLVQVAWRLIEHACGYGAPVTVRDLVRLHDASGHPEVISQNSDPATVTASFRAAWGCSEDTVITAHDFVEFYTDLSAGIDSDTYFELMMRNAWHISGGFDLTANTTCMRVLVVFEDGRQANVEVKDDLGIHPSTDELSIIRRRLEKQGVRNIARIVLPPSARD